MKRKRYRRKVRKRGEEKENEEGEGGVPRVREAQQEQVLLDEKVGGCDGRGVRIVLQNLFLNDWEDQFVCEAFQR